MNNITPIEVFIILFIVSGLVAIGGLLIFKLSGLRVEIVPQGKQLIIYQLGTFKRIAGPGPVIIRSLETIEQTVDVRNQPHQIPVQGLFCRGIPFGYTLEIWYRPALDKLAESSPQRLAQFVEFNDRERQEMVKTKVFDAVSKSVSQIQEDFEPDGPEFVYNLLPIIPNLPVNTRMMTLAKERLTESLTTIGIELDQSQELMITGLSINDQVAAGLGRGQIVRLLREHFPSLSEDVLLEAMASIDNVRLPHSRITIHSDGEASVDVRTDEDGEAEARVRTRAGGKARQPTPTSNPEVAVEQTTDEDWNVLKRVPAA